MYINIYLGQFKLIKQKTSNQLNLSRPIKHKEGKNKVAAAKHQL